MPPSKLLPVAGKLHAALFKLPVVGETLVRGANRALGHVAFRAPYFGAQKQSSIREVMDAWFAFLGKNGITPRIDKMEGDTCLWSVEACPYGYCCAADRGVCDAVMDLDRTYTKLLGGEMVILERIPDGKPSCRYQTRFKG
ncbi:MAG: hypothetical protein AB1921_00430 [Thermodesulfobacteriota bacterium]